MFFISVILRNRAAQNLIGLDMGDGGKRLIGDDF